MVEFYRSVFCKYINIFYIYILKLSQILFTFTPTNS